MSGGRRTARGEDFGDTGDFSSERRSRRRDRREYEEKPRREKTSKIDPTVIMIGITVVLVIGVLATFLVLGIKNGQSSQKEPTNQVSAEIVVEEEPKLEETYEGIKVLGKIKIDSIDVEQYILDSTSDKALKLGVGKLYGGNLNSSGNLSIAGHNEKDKFQDLEELEKGDTFIIIDKDLKETTYKITDITSVEPDDLECLRSDDSKTEITLITCQNGTTSRLIVKAEKTNSVDNV